MRLPKDGYFAHQVMWDGWVDVERPSAYIIGHWNYASDTKKDVYVVSSADKVELFVNGMSKGFGEQSSRFLFTFTGINWQPGVIKAVGYDLSGRKLCESEKQSAAEPYAIRLTPRTDPAGLQANGADLALVDVEVVDNQGRRCPTALNLINFTLAGPAEWRGGIAQGPDNYILAKSLPVECGVNRIIIRAGTHPGKIVLRASSAGLKSANIEIVSRPASGSNGISLMLPGDNLPSYLGRGPTPGGDGVNATRRAILISRATSGANDDKASASFDDNEVTDWANDGQLATAWIDYELARPASINAVVLKLGDWRTRSYP
jgi:hypothetical protein